MQNYLPKSFLFPSDLEQMPGHSELPLLGSTPNLGRTCQWAPDADCLEPGDLPSNHPTAWFIKEPQGWFWISTCARCHQGPGAQDTTVAAPLASPVPGKSNERGHRGWYLPALRFHSLSCLCLTVPSLRARRLTARPVPDILSIKCLQF